MIRFCCSSTCVRTKDNAVYCIVRAMRMSGTLTILLFMIVCFVRFGFATRTRVKSLHSGQYCCFNATVYFQNQLATLIEERYNHNIFFKVRIEKISAKINLKRA